MDHKPYIPKYIRYLFLSFLALLVINSVFRIVFLFNNKELTGISSNLDICYALFNRGLLFDIYIACLILLIPFLLTSIPFIRNNRYKLVYQISNWIIIILGIINISALVTDIGFFEYYNSRLTNSVFDWTNDMGLMFKIMLSDNSYLIFYGVFIAISILFVFIQVRILKRVSMTPEPHFQKKMRLIVFFGSLIILLTAIRGTFRLDHRPLNYDDSYFSENPFLNQLGFNPVYTLVHSYTDDKIDYFKTNKEAVKTALKFLDRESGKYSNPFEIKVEVADSLEKKPNIILIFLESMSNDIVSRYNPHYRTTPFLDGLANQGIIFDNFFSSGIHTYNGIFSSLYGLPAIMHNNPLNSVQTVNLKFNGLPSILKQKNYNTSFYVTGEKKFDNMNGFLIPNGFDKMIGEIDYPKDSIYNGWGVTDNTMFNRILTDCDSLHDKNTRFFIAALTITSHDGYLIPSEDEDKVHNTKYPYALYEYADLILSKFMKSVQKKNWFDNTVFVFVGDHGQNFTSKYDMCLSYHRVPLIIYAPKYFNHRQINSLGIQQDIYPTLLGLLNMNYINTSLGVDLFKHNRKFAYFSADNKLGIIDNKYYLIYRGKENISMYNIHNYNIKDIYSKNRPLADTMKMYGFSMLQSAQYLINKGLTN